MNYEQRKAAWEFVCAWIGEAIANQPPAHKTLAAEGLMARLAALKPEAPAVDAGKAPAKPRAK